MPLNHNETKQHLISVSDYMQYMNSISKTQRLSVDIDRLLYKSYKHIHVRPQFESCHKSSSDHGTTCINLNLVESEKFSAWMKCTRNHHSRVIA